MILDANLSRRVLLEGLGITVALPWLESVGAFAAAPPAKKSAPQRFAWMFIGDGISPPHWWARGKGADMELGPSLKPLAGFEDTINVINGLFNREGDGGHARCISNILSGAALRRGRTIKGGVSMDQLLARHYEEDTASPGLVLGCEQPVSGFHESQYSMVYASHISWRTPDSPGTHRTLPLAGLRQPVRRQSRQTPGKHPRRGTGSSHGPARKGKRHRPPESGRVSIVGARDGTARPAVEQVGQGGRPRRIPASKRPPAGQPKNFREYARLMCDIIALAFQTDRTRITSLLLSRDLSGQVYPFLGIRDDHHSYSHSNTGKEYQAIVQCHVEQYAYLVDKLAKMQEG